jgi:hypothetical protein
MRNGYGDAAVRGDQTKHFIRNSKQDEYIF